jgi:hypothetical protein
MSSPRRGSTSSPSKNCCRRNNPLLPDNKSRIRASTYPGRASYGSFKIRYPRRRTAASTRLWCSLQQQQAGAPPERSVPGPDLPRWHLLALKAVRTVDYCAPLDLRNSDTSVWPATFANPRAVVPVAPFRLTSAPFCTSSFTISSLFLDAAAIKAVIPLLS